MHTLTDWRGTPIDKGCTLVYPGRSSGDLWMTEATVEDIIEVDVGHGIMKPALRVRRTKAMRGTINNTRILTAVDRVTVVVTGSEAAAMQAEEPYDILRGT